MSKTKPKQYVASIMNRLYLGDQNFLYYMSHTALGEYDEDTSVFVDKNGDEYLPITNPYILASEVSEGYTDLIDVDELSETLGQSNQNAIADYNFYCRSILHYVSYTGNGDVFDMPINYLDIRDSIERIINGLPEEETEELFSRDYEDSDETYHNSLLSSDVRADIVSFFIDLMDGVYSLEDLKEIREKIETQRDDIDALLDSIDIQIEASENGESSIELRKEQSVPKPKKKGKQRRKESSQKPEIKHLDIEDLFNKITTTLIAQDEPTRRVLIEIARKEQSELNNDRGILITGATGTGKTKMMELIARYLDRPFLKVDSTQLTVPGYVGKDIEEVLWELYVKCGKDKEKAERAIIFFDEIDKKGSSKKDDISGKGVLNVLLPFFDGATYDATESMKHQREVVQINTRNMLVILAGAFEDVYSDLRAKRDIGFATTSTTKPGNRPAETQDFIDKAKMPAEFMGRVAIVKLNDLTLEDIKRILVESDESALRIQERLFEELGVKLTSSDGYINAIAEQAMKRKTGARGLNTVVDETTWEAYGEVYTHLGQYSEIILERDTVENPKQYIRVPKKK